MIKKYRYDGEKKFKLSKVSTDETSSRCVWLFFQ